MDTANDERDNRASWVWLYCFLAFAVLVGALRWHFGMRSAGLMPVARRSAMEDLELPQLGGGQWKLADHRGQVVLVNYWATWCEPCRDELPGLMQVARDSGPRGLAVVGVSVDEGANAQARVGQFVERYRIAYPVAFSEVPAGNVFGGFRLPTTVLVDRRGRVAKRYVGEVEHEDLAQDVAALLAES